MARSKRYKIRGMKYRKSLTGWTAYANIHVFDS